MAYVRRYIERPRVFEVPCDHALSRIRPFNRPLKVGDRRFTSVMQMFASCCFTQHNMVTESRDFWSRRRSLDQTPSMIQNVVRMYFKSHNIEFRASWLVNVKAVMCRVILTVIEEGDPDFVHCFNRTFDNYGAHVQFVEVSGSSTERLWSSGHAAGRLPQDIQDYAGANLYGEALTDVYLYLKAGISQGIENSHPFRAFLNRCVLPCTGYQKTAVIISDSSLRHAKSIEDGDVWYQSGYTAGQLATAILVRHGNLMNYKYVIIFAGTNDAQLLNTDEERESSFRMMADLVLHLGHHPHTIVIWNTGIGLPKWPRVPEYTLWFKQRYARELGNFPNFHLVDWSLPSSAQPGSSGSTHTGSYQPENFFLTSSGQPEPSYIHPDEKHMNLKGTRRVWKDLSLRIPVAEGLRAIRFCTSVKKYEAIPLEERQSLA